MSDPIILYVDDKAIQLTMGVQGPPGPPGDGSGSQALAGETISAYGVVVLIGGLVYKANYTDSSHGSLVAGIATNSADPGSSVNICHSGIVEGGTFPADSLLYVGADGDLSATPLGVGATWKKRIGVSQGTDKIFIDMDPTIFV